MDQPMPEPPEPESAPEVEAEPVNEAPQQPPPVAETPPQKTTALAKTNGEALATAPSTSFDGGLQPGTLGAAWKLAQGIYNSRLYQRLPRRASGYSTRAELEGA